MFFSSSINVLCEIKFNNTQVNFLPSESKVKDVETQNLVTSKYTSTSIGQNPKWESELFNFSYNRLSKTGQKLFASIKDIKLSDVDENVT